MQRREFIKASTGAVGLSLLPMAGFTKEIPGISQVLGVQNFRIGEWVVTALLDGTIDIGAESFTGLSETEATDFLRRAFKADGPVTTGVNAYILRNEERVVLVDAGGAGAFPGMGALAASIDAAGIAVDSVSDVLLTHLHPDHIGGLLLNGNAVFPNAKIHVHQADIDFWTSTTSKSKAPEAFHPFFDLATAVIKTYDSNVKAFDSDGEILPDITSRQMPGHTPGHSGFLLSSSNDSLLIWGDIILVEAFQFPKPTASIGFDIDAAMSVETRLRVFDEVATNRTKVAGTHLSFPGIGHVKEVGNSYDFEPADWTFKL